MNKRNEIFNIWYELTLLRLLMCHFFEQNMEISSSINESLVNELRKEAQQIVQDKFPAMKLDFSEISPEQLEKNKKHTENLHVLNKLMGITIPK